MGPSKHVFLFSIFCFGILSAQEPPPDSSSSELLQPIPWTLTRFSANDLRQYPGRTLELFLQLVPGIASVNGGLYGRGSRNNQIGYRVNGLSVIDRYSGTNGFAFIPEAMEKVIVHTGAYGASLGENAGGVVEMKMREGGETWSVSAKHYTDDFASTGKQFLNTYSYGQHTSVFTLGGPLPYDTRLFVAAEIHRQRDRNPMYIEPFEYTFVTDNLGTRPAGQPLPGPFEIVNQHVPATSEQRSTLQWNAASTFFGPKVQFWGSVARNKNREATWGSLVHNFYRQKRIPWLNEQTDHLGFTIDHELSSSMKVGGSILYSNSRRYTSDPDFGEDWWNYSDSLRNAEKGYGGFTSRYTGPQTYSTIQGFWFSHPNEPNSTYWKKSAINWQGKLTFTLKVSEEWTSAVDLETESWTLRQFSILSVRSLRSSLDPDLDGVSNPVPYAGLEGEVWLRRVGSVYGFGYDGWGNESDDAPFGARHPQVTTLTFDNTVIQGPVRIRLGVHAKQFREDIPTIDQRTDVVNGMPTIPFDYNLSMVPSSAMNSSPIRTYILPRASFNYTGERSQAFVAFGAYVDPLPYELTQIDNRLLSDIIAPSWRVVYNLGGNVVTYQAVPERTEIFEAGIQLRATDRVTLSGTVFTKSMPNQVELGRVDIDDDPRDPVGLTNRGEGSSLGADIAVNWTLTDELRLALQFSYLDARGHSSSPRDNQIEVTDDPYFSPKVLYPFEYQLKHKVLCQLQFEGAEGSDLAGLDFLLLAKVNSGHPYTRMPGASGYGANSPWTIGVNYFSSTFRRESSEPQNVSVTPWTTSVDLSAGYKVDLGPTQIRFLASILNLFDTKNSENLFATTGTSTSDGWFANPLATFILPVPGYQSLYRDLNLRNRWAYNYMSGNDIYSSPRQVRFGVEVEL